MENEQKNIEEKFEVAKEVDIEHEQLSPVVKIWEWVVALIILAIPVVNVVMIIVWLVTLKNKSKRNFVAAAGIMMIIGVVLSFVLSAIVANVMQQQFESAAFNSYNQMYMQDLEMSEDSFMEMNLDGVRVIEE